MTLLFGAPKVHSSPSPAAVKATIDNKETFGKLLEEAIDETFSCMGEPQKEALYIFLKNSFGIAKQEIPNRIEDFSDALKKIFGSSARSMEILCMKNIQAKAKIHYNCDFPESISFGLTLKDYIYAVKQNYEKQEPNRRAKSKSTSAKKKSEAPKTQGKTDENRGTLKTANVMVRRVITVDEKASVKDAVNIMNQFEIGSVIVTRRGKPVGIITERDILRRIVSEGKNAKKTSVKEIMSSPLIVISPSTDLEEAACLMFEKKIKKLPVTENNRLLGLISLTDIARAQPMVKFLQKLSESQNMPKSMQKVLNCYIV